jgi:hypothetical protein
MTRIPSGSPSEAVSAAMSAASSTRICSTPSTCTTPELPPASIRSNMKNLPRWLFLSDSLDRDRSRTLPPPKLSGRQPTSVTIATVTVNIVLTDAGVSPSPTPCWWK